MDMFSSPQTGNTLKGWIFSRTGVATAVCIAILGFLIYEGHGAHLLGLLPYALLLACPLMHVFMHGGHHHSDLPRNQTQATPPANSTDATAPAVNQPPHRYRGG